MSPPFQYDSYVSPYTASIGDLLLRRGDIAAREAAAKGAAWGGAAQGIGNAVAGAIEQQTDPRRQLEVQQVDANKKAIVFGDTMNKITASLMTEQKDGSRVIDRGKLQQALSAANVPIAMQQAQFKALDDVDASIKGFTTARVDHAADMAHGTLQAIAAGGDPETSLATALALSKANGLITDDQVAPIIKAVSQGADIPQLLTQIRGLSEKYKDSNKGVVLPPTPEGAAPATLVAPDGRVIATGGQSQPKPKTEPELAADAANPQSPTQATSQATLDKLREQKNPASLEEQYLSAVTKGDTAGAGRILQSLKDTAAAKRDPAMQAVSEQLKNLSVQEAQQRLDALKEKNKPGDVSQSTFTTMSGRQYVDLGEFQTPEAREKARQAAITAGVVPVNKEVADGLRAADTARANFKAMWTQLEPYLPKDAAGRLLVGPKNKLEKIFQTNPTLGAIGSWRTAAIQAVQALAEKGMGLRLNRSEIDLMLQNDIPQITDDGATAKQRIDNMMTLLDHKEQDALVRDRSSLGTAPAAGQPVKVGGFTVTVKP